jgi:hypothetical protein
MSFVPAAAVLATLLAVNAAAGVALSQRGQIVVLAFSVLIDLGSKYFSHRRRGGRLEQEGGEYAETPRWYKRTFIVLLGTAGLMFATRHVSEAGVIWFAGNLIIQTIWAALEARRRFDQLESP